MDRRWRESVVLCHDHWHKLQPDIDGYARKVLVAARNNVEVFVTGENNMNLSLRHVKTDEIDTVGARTNGCGEKMSRAITRS